MSANEALKGDLESLPALVARLDERQKAWDDRIVKVETAANYAVKLGEENKVVIAGMPEEFRTVLREEREREREDRRGNRMEFKEWLTVVMVVIALIVSLPAAIQSVQSIGKPQVEKVN